MTDIRRDLARNTLAIACIVGLIALSLWVLRPFLAATVWAAMVRQPDTSTLNPPPPARDP